MFLSPGLAGALALLKERGELSAPVEWAGRTNDMRSDKLAQLADVYTGGRHDSNMDAHIEAALTRRDEFGRVMTPKEAFRALCYKCAPCPTLSGLSDDGPQKQTPPPQPSVVAVMMVSCRTCCLQSGSLK